MKEGKGEEEEKTKGEAERGGKVGWKTKKTNLRQSSKKKGSK